MSVTLRKETNLYDTDAIQDGINAAVTDYDTNLGQTRVFNKLTNNGTAQGIFMENGQLYINMSYLQTGTLKVGGLNNINGLMQVLSYTGSVVCQLDDDGLTVFDGKIVLYPKTSDRLSDIRVGEIMYSGGTGEFPTGVTLASLRTQYYTSSTITSGTEWYLGEVTPCAFTVEKYRYTSSSSSSNVISGGITLESIYLQATSGNVFRYNLSSGTFYVSGTKSRRVNTDDYGKRFLYCYETPSPLFGDVGEGTISSDGKCYVMIDSIFAETVSLNQYQVTLQKYGQGDCWVSERNGAYFVVEGTPGLSFGWELKSKQSDFDQYRLEKDVGNFSTENSMDYGTELISHIEEVKREREVA